MSNSEERLRSGSFFSLLVSLSLPAVIIILIMIIYNIADTFFIGQTGDPAKIAAISLSMPLFSILSGIGTLFGNGGCTAISIALGEGNREKITKITTFCFVGALVTGLVFFLFTFLCTRQVALLLGADDETLNLTITYLKTFSFACPFVLLTGSFGNILRADGDSGVAMIPSMTGTIVNILLDAFFILVLHLDVFGAALATVLGNILSTILLLSILLKKKKFLIPDFSQFTFQKDISVPVLTLGLPMMISTVLGSIASAVQNRMMLSYGSEALAAQSVAGKVGMIITMLIIGICTGMQPAISYNYGAKDFKRMYRIVRETGLFTVVVGIGLTVVAWFTKDAVVAAFINNENVITLGGTFVIAAVVVGPFYGIYQMAQTFLQATGKVTYAIMASTLDKCVVFLPVLFVMNSLWGSNGIAFAHAVTMVFTLLITLLLTIKWSRTLKTQNR